ncbi:MAG TPA: signal peptidase I [Candidatus Dormibacteraeota bacterium]|nr:signal peptidase I [Candidatus Dormibacteraeota bacterium]
MAKKDDKLEEKDAADEKPKETTVEFLASLAAVLVTGLFIITFVVQAFEIPSSSMENTLLIGDHVFVNRIQFAPKTGWVGPLLPYRDVHFRDIVVFLSPQTPGLYVVKRIIGVPGDKIHLRNGVVYRNGQPLDEPYVLHDRDTFDQYRNSFPAVPPPPDDPNIWVNWAIDLPSYIQGEDVVVPPGHFFAMGDHRGVSLDSRYWGFIPQENVIGRPMFIYWSFETPEGQYLKTAWTDRLKFILGHEVLHFFDETHWKRTLQRVQ